MTMFSKVCAFAIALCVLSFSVASAGESWRLPKGPIQGTPILDLPAPSGMQSVVLKDSVEISWDWVTPEVMPDLMSLGFEILRQDGKVFIVAGHSFSDGTIGIGSYSYKIRARGESKAKTHGVHVSHISDWSASVGATLTQTCTDPPQITLTAQTTQKEYSSIPSLRMHLVGDALVPEACHLQKVSYHIDTGTGILHTGTLEVDAHGHFDTIVNAIGPEDEIPSGVASFAISASAEDEAGPTTSAVYTIDVQLKNPFAPRS